MSGSQSVSQYHTQPQPSSYPSNVGSAKVFSFGLGLQILTPILTLTLTINSNPSNMGSAKLLSFGVLAGLSKEETLALFGSYE